MSTREYPPENGLPAPDVKYNILFSLSTVEQAAACKVEWMAPLPSLFNTRRHAATSFVRAG